MAEPLIAYPTDFFDLTYRATNTKVLLGDHVLFMRWFGLVKTPCRVCYVPGVSPPHREMQYAKEAAMWAIDDEKGNVYTMLYVPTDKFITKRIVFIRRADDEYSGLSANSRIE